MEWNNEYGPPPKAGFNGRATNTPNSSSSGRETETQLSSSGRETETLLSLPAVKFSSVFSTVFGDSIPVFFGEEKMLSSCCHGSTEFSAMSTGPTPNSQKPLNRLSKMKTSNFLLYSIIYYIFFYKPPVGYPTHQCRITASFAFADVDKLPW